MFYIFYLHFHFVSIDLGKMEGRENYHSKVANLNEEHDGGLKKHQHLNRISSKYPM